jgi:hypothetical protein
MIRKYTDEEFMIAKSDDKLKFECYQCGSIFLRKKKYVLHEFKRNKNEIKFCNLKCFGLYKNKKIQYNCSNCNSIIFKTKRDIKRSKSGNLFCNSSCSAMYNNTHKKTGTRRSKLEFWIEEELKKMYEFEIIFNDKKRINSELDIYIPSLNLAFELNGIFHYEPIYGEEKLKKIENNDNRKYQACLENKIELCILDTSSSKKFKPERDIKYLNIIKSIIEEKINKIDKY